MFYIVEEEELKESYLSPIEFLMLAKDSNVANNKDFKNLKNASKFFPDFEFSVKDNKIYAQVSGENNVKRKNRVVNWAKHNSIKIDDILKVEYFKNLTHLTQLEAFDFAVIYLSLFKLYRPDLSENILNSIIKYFGKLTNIKPIISSEINIELLEKPEKLAENPEEPEKLPEELEKK